MICVRHVQVYFCLGEHSWLQCFVFTVVRCYVAWTRVLLLETGEYPYVGLALGKNLGHGNLVLKLDTGTETRPF